MSATNHTTNYNLPQFIGTDKPTWLTDVNGALSAIDTQMKANADSATSASSSATTANNAIGTLANLETTAKTDLVSAVNEVNTNVGVAQNTANGASSTAQTTSNNLNAFESKFNLTDITNSQIPATGNVDAGKIYLAQDTTGSIFKCYGGRTFFSSSTITFSAIAGMTGYYGADTGLVLNTAPTEAYIIDGAGIRLQSDNSDTNVRTMSMIQLAVGTNGHIYAYPKTTSSNITIPNGVFERYIYFANLYFNTSFGDTPAPENN